VSGNCQSVIRLSIFAILCEQTVKPCSIVLSRCQFSQYCAITLSIFAVLCRHAITVCRILPCFAIDLCSIVSSDCQSWILAVLCCHTVDVCCMVWLDYQSLQYCVIWLLAELCRQIDNLWSRCRQTVNLCSIVSSHVSILAVLCHHSINLCSIVSLQFQPLQHSVISVSMLVVLCRHSVNLCGTCHYSVNPCRIMSSQCPCL
jgi:hypothetical protein